MAMTASLSINGLVIAGRKARLMLAVSNSSASDAVTVTGVQFVSRPVNTTAAFGQINFAGPGVSSSVPALSTNYYPCDVVFQRPQINAGTAGVTGQHLVYAVCTFSDSTTFTTPMVSVVVSDSSNTPPGSGANTALGQLRFDNGFQSGLLELVGPVP